MNIFSESRLTIWYNLRTMAKNKSEKTKYTTDSKIVCPDCSEEVQVGTGGERNLDNSCICDRTVSAAEIEAGDLVMACKVPGCETVWFHRACMDHDFAPRNWSCPSCKATGTTGKRRRT
ncbi:hypothetical protein BDZ94DRAFT_1276297 [Collybia nuda]|uniref:Zinc finger PHD-type domain-containing protein n=1 Tax=Collybia nuda TaxID=64659 RepID=A0A9P5XSR9_9AGAR|nr:hypothetical protein BDZ94DRAFT_1276297 [Collybia nuda]